MIYPASTLVLATLVFNAASGLGAPLRTSQPGARAVDFGDPVLPRVEIVDVKPHQRSVSNSPLSARAIKLNRAVTPEDIESRDIVSSEEIEARDPLPEVQKLVRRYPRKVYADFYEARSETAPEARAPEPEPIASRQVERRYPRRALYERHEARSDPAPTPEARSEPVEPAQLQRRYPRKVYAEYYEKRSTPPSAPEQPVAREPEPQAEVVRRFPRRVYAEYYKRQTAGGANLDPALNPAPATPPVVDPALNPVTPPVVDPALAATGQAAPPVAGATSTGAAVQPNVQMQHSTQPVDVNRLIGDLAQSDDNGFQPGTTVKETTVIVHKITHLGADGNVIQDNGQGNGQVNGQVGGQVNNSPPIVNAGTPPTATPLVTNTASATATASASVDTAAAAAASATQSAAVNLNAGGVGDPALNPQPAAASVGDPALNPAAASASSAATSSTDSAAASATPAVVTPPAAGRRSLGFSGPAWASHVIRSSRD